MFAFAQWFSSLRSFRTQFTYLFSVMIADFFLFIRRSRRQWLLGTLGTVCLVIAASRALASQPVELSWTDNFDPNVVSHNVYYGTQSENYSASNNFAEMIAPIIPGFEDGATYYFAVAAVDCFGNESGLSSEAVFTVPPSAPLALLVQGSTAALDAVQISWSPSPESDVYGYYVRYGTQSGVYTSDMEFDFTTNGLIPGLAGGVTNYFIVSAIDPFGIQPFSSSEVSFVVPAPAQIVLSAQASANPPGVALSWNALPHEGVAAYCVFAGNQSGDYGSEYTTSNTNLLITALPAGQTNYFAVAAIDGYGDQGPLSAEVSVAVPEPAMVLQSQIDYDDSGRPYQMEIFNPSPVSGYWELDYSTDLQNWTPWPWPIGSGDGNGNGYDVDVWVPIEAKAPQMYFRVIQ